MQTASGIRVRIAAAQVEQRVPKLKGESHLPNDPSEVRWIHANLALEFIGAQDPLAFAAVCEELDRVTLQGTVSRKGPSGSERGA